jgi:hypothetical protein
MQYQNNLADINQVRYILFTRFYNNAQHIENLRNIIAGTIECLSIDYVNTHFAFSIKIKKTAMRKRYHGFNHNPIFHYKLIQDIFSKFIMVNEHELLNILACKYENPQDALLSIRNNPAIMANLAHVTCMDDNIIAIKL